MTHTAIRRTVSVLLSLMLVFTLACTAALAEPMQAVGTMTFSGMDVSVRFFVDDTTNLMTLEASMTQEGEGIAVSAAFSDAGICFSFPPFVNEWYGVNVFAAAENLPTSIFAPGSGSAFALDEETYASVMTSLTQAATGVSAMAGNEEAVAAENVYEQMAEEYVTLIQEKLAAGMTSSSSYETVTIAGEEIEAAVSITTFSPEAMSSALNALVEKLGADEAFAALAAQSGAPEDGVAQLTASITEIASMISENQLPTTAILMSDRETGTPVYANLQLGSEEAGMGLELINVTATKSLQAYTLEGETKDIPYAAELQLGSTEEGAMTATVIVVSESKRALVAEGSLDLSTGGFTLSVDSLEGAFSLAGTFTFDEAGNIIVAFSELNGEPSDLVVTIGAAESETAPAYYEILTMSEEEFAQFVQQVSQIAEFFGAGEETPAA